MKKLMKIATVLILIVFITVSSGCATTMRAIEHAQMTTTVRMSKTIFLDPVALKRNKTVYIRVTNTSDMQEIDFENLLKERLQLRGITITQDPEKAGYIVQANVLYMNFEREGMTADGMLLGGYGGALAGAFAGGDWRGSLVGAGIGGLAGALVGGAIGAAFQVKTFFGTIDIQIQEKVASGVKGTMVTDAKQGEATVLRTEREVVSDFQTYTTRVVAKAKQTNIDRVEAAKVISEKLAIQIAGMF